MFRGIVLAVFIPVALYADRITIHNKTGDDIYIAQYYLFGNTATRGTLPKKMEQESSTIMELLPFKPFQYRELAFSLNESDLKPTFTAADFKALRPKNVGIGEGTNFYIAKSNKGLTGYNTTQWNAVKPVVESIEKQVEDLRRTSTELLTMIAQNPYRNTIAYARVGNELAVDEQRYRDRRKKIVANKLEKLLNKKISYVPEIALVCSGGGTRAMLSALGALNGCYLTGLYDLLLYVCGLSGSTWAIGGFLSSTMNISDYKEWVVKSLKNGLAPSFGELSGISNLLLLKKSFKQPTGLVDLYGALLANLIFRFSPDKRQRMVLSEQIKRIEKAQDPFPIYTAVHAEIGYPEEWYEFTPYEIGSPWQGVYIPSWSFGRRFEKGVSIDFATEQSFGFLLGIYGSAFAATARKIYKEYIENSIKIEMVRTIISSILESPSGEVRPFIPAYVANFMQGISQSKTPDSPLLALGDAGFDFNLPYPPISGRRSERKADIIIVIDASSAVPDEFVLVEQYAKKHGLAFPTINYTGIDKKAISIFKDERNPSVPVVIYLPLIIDRQLWNSIKDKPDFKQYYMYLEHFNLKNCIANEQCGTFNFTYNEWQARQMAAVMECNVRACSGIILKEIEALIARKSNSK